MKFKKKVPSIESDLWETKYSKKNRNILQCLKWTVAVQTRTLEHKKTDCTFVNEQKKAN